MRFALVFLLLGLLPLSGCTDSPPPVAVLGSILHFSPVERGEPTLPVIQDCPALLAALKERSLLEADVQLDGLTLQKRGPYILDYFLEDAGAFAPRLAAASVSVDALEADTRQVTGTNNQEVGADEGDILKTDGLWTYVLDGATLHILRSPKVGDVVEMGTVELGAGWGGTLLLERRNVADPRDDLLLAAFPDNSYGGRTRVLVFGLLDPAHPAQLKEMQVEGTPVETRLIDGTAYIVVHAPEASVQLQTWVDVPTEPILERGIVVGQREATEAEFQEAVRATSAQNHARVDALTIEDFLPAVRDGGDEAQDLPVEAGCGNVYITPNTTGHGVTTILSLEMGGEFESATTQVVGSEPTVYANTESIVLASMPQEMWWFREQPDLVEMTDLHMFALDGLEVKPVAAGRVLGIVEDAFGLDVHDGALRVVSATGTYHRGWLPETSLETAITVFDPLDGVLVPRGTVAGIAPGERLWSVRFTDERAYIVTFNGMDPLFVVDLEAPIPILMGELKVAGVSTYIHPLAGDKLLTIGYGAENGDYGLDEGRILVSLFDVKDPMKPKPLEVLDLSPPGGGSMSGALHEHKAFTYWSAVGVLAIPGTSYGQEGYKSGLKLIDVDEKAGTLELRGEINQERLLGPEGCCSGEVSRSFFLGTPGKAVSVYAISHLGVTANDLATLLPQGATSFGSPGGDTVYID